MSGQPLYKINNKFMHLQNLLEDDVIDEETYKDTLESIDLELEDKAEGYAIIMKNYENEVENLDKEIKRLQSRKTVAQNKHDRLKESLFASMELTGKTKFRTKLFSFNVRNNSPSVNVLNEEEVPKDYWKSQPDKLDKKKILEDLKNDKSVDGAIMQRTRSLIIK